MQSTSALSSIDGTAVVPPSRNSSVPSQSTRPSRPSIDPVSPGWDSSSWQVTGDSIRHVGLSVFGVCYLAILIVWALRARGNFWLIFIPLVTATWTTLGYMTVRFIIAIVHRGLDENRYRSVPYFMSGFTLAMILIFSTLVCSDIVISSQSYWTITQLIQPASNTSSGSTLIALNVENCAGLTPSISTVDGQVATGWALRPSLSQYIFGRESLDQIQYELGRAMTPQDEWVIQVMCTSFFQPNVIVPLLQYSGVPLVGMYATTDDYQRWSFYMWITLMTSASGFCVMAMIMIGLRRSPMYRYLQWSDLISTCAPAPDDTDAHADAAQPPVASLASPLPPSTKQLRRTPSSAVAGSMNHKVSIPPITTTESIAIEMIPPSSGGTDRTTDLPAASTIAASTLAMDDSVEREPSDLQYDRKDDLEHAQPPPTSSSSTMTATTAAVAPRRTSRSSQSVGRVTTGGKTKSRR